MIAVANYGGMDLFQMRNRQGYRAIEMAERIGNYECFFALQKLERNLGVQTSIVEREIQISNKGNKK